MSWWTVSNAMTKSHQWCLDAHLGNNINATGSGEWGSSAQKTWGLNFQSGNFCPNSLLAQLLILPGLCSIPITPSPWGACAWRPPGTCCCEQPCYSAPQQWVLWKHPMMVQPWSHSLPKWNMFNFLYYRLTFCQSPTSAANVTPFVFCRDSFSEQLMQCTLMQSD